MDQSEAISVVIGALGRVAPDVDGVTLTTPLLGSDGVLESMTLVELCLELEDVAEARGFSFDWTSDSAMSRSRSMFQTVETLAADLASQASSQE